MKIPNPARLGRDNPQDRTGVSQRRNLAGQGLDEVGSALNEIANKQLDYQEDKVRSEFLKEKTQIEQQLKEDPENPEKLGEKYREKVRERASELSKNIGSGRRREAFMQDVEVDAEQGAAQMDRFGFKIAQDRERADTKKQLSDLRDVFASSDEPVEAVGRADSLIDNATESGYFDEEEAQRLRESWRQEAAVNRIQSLDPGSQLEALDQEWASNLDAGTRAEMRRRAESKHNDYLAQQAVDGYLQQGMSRKDIRTNIREQYADQPNLRKEVENRFEREVASRDRAEREEKEQAAEQALEAIQGGAPSAAEQMVTDDEPTSVSDLPPSVSSKLDNQTVAALRNVEMKRARGETITTDPNAYYDLTNMAGDEPQKFLKTNLVKYRHRLSDQDYQSLRGMKEELRKGTDTEVKSLRNRNQVVDDTMQMVGIDPNEDAKEAAQFRDRANMMLSEYQRNNNGKMPQPTEWNQMVKRMASEVKLPNTGWFGTNWGNETERAFRLPQGTEVEMEVDDVPEVDRRMIEDALRRREIEPTEDAIVRYYLKGSGLQVTE